MTVDYYKNSNEELEAVVWLKSGKPLNEELINAGVATPISTPPTNIVNRLMFNHYLKLLKRNNYEKPDEI